MLQLRGVRPFPSNKYDLTQHPNYKLTADYDPKNILDIEKYIQRKAKLKPNDVYIVVMRMLFSAKVDKFDWKNIITTKCLQFNSKHVIMQSVKLKAG